MSVKSEKSDKSLLSDVCLKRKVGEIAAVRCLSIAKSRINRCCQTSVTSKTQGNRCCLMSVKSEKSDKSLLSDVCLKRKVGEIAAVRCLSIAKSRINRCCQTSVTSKTQGNRCCLMSVKSEKSDKSLLSDVCLKRKVGEIAAVRCLSIAKSRINRCCQTSVTSKIHGNRCCLMSVKIEKSDKSLLSDVCLKQKVGEIAAVRCLSIAKSRINRCCQTSVTSKTQGNRCCLMSVKSEKSDKSLLSDVCLK